MKRVIAVILFVLMCLMPIHVKAEESQTVTGYNQMAEAQGNATVTYKAGNVIHIDKGENNGNGPNTGDSTKLALWTMTGFISLMTLLFLLFLSRRDREEILC